MILTVCPNPSIDCTIELDSLNVGMLNRIENKVETYSGKALNVAIGVARLGGKCVTTGFMFSSHKELFEKKLSGEGVAHRFVSVNGSARVNYKIIDKKSMLTEINDVGEMVSPDKQGELLQLVSGLSENSSIAVISGSLPKGVESSYYNKLVKAVRKGQKIIIDAEKQNMLSATEDTEIYMAKPNLPELESFSGMTIRTKKDMVKASRKYFDRGVQNVLVSLGRDGAVLTNGSESYFCRSESVAVNSTVGAGDSMVSAVSVGLKMGVDMPELLKMAVAAGTAAVTTSGTNLFYKDKYEEIYAKIKTEKII